MRIGRWVDCLHLPKGQHDDPVIASVNQTTLNPRLAERVESLGVTVASVADDGWATIQGTSRWIERLITDSPLFAEALKKQLQNLRIATGTAQEIWPGVWLAPLRVQRHRRVGMVPVDPPLMVAFFLSSEILDSPWLEKLCDDGQLDHASVLDRIDREALVSRAEAQRLARVLDWMHHDSVEIDRRHLELRTLSQQLGDSYEELSLLYKLSVHMAVNHSPAQFLTDACRELQQVIGLRWLALLLVDDDQRLNGLSGQIYTAGYVGSDVNLIKRFGHILLLQQRATTEPLIIENTEELGIPHLSRVADHLLVVTLMRNGVPFGVLFGADKQDGRHITSADAKLCNTLANSISIFLQNMMLYEDMQTMFMGTLHALTHSIDAKDSYTHGHSERVALMAKNLALAIGLDTEEAERVYLSALVHDVGKIGVPEAVLCKAGPLTDDEFELIKRHPEIGAHILANIRQMQDLIPGVLYHHERWDGGGYPHRLSGEDIPLYGRLICLADSFDAMSSNRSYRPALEHSQVLEEIRRCAGKQFDPQLADAFVKLDFEPFFELIKHHIQLDEDRKQQQVA